MTLLLAWGAKLLARPALLVGLVSAVAIGGLTLKAKIDKGRHEKEVAALTQTIAARDLTIANQQTAISAEREIVTKLQGTITEQNSAIALWQARAKSSDALAAKRALEAIRAGEAVADLVRANHEHRPPGHESVNQQLRERFQQ